jgi:hypothetical protein
MAYAILNPNIYYAAFSGAMAGMTGYSMGSGQATAVAANYSVQANAAFAFAQSYDTNRGGSPSLPFENLLTSQLCKEAFENRNPGLVTNVNVPATWTGLSADILAAVTEAINVSNAGTTGTAGAPNFAFITADATANGEGSGGPTIVAAIQLVSKYTGVFDWTASAVQAAAAATEVVTWIVTTQTAAGAPAFTFTGGTPAKGGISTGAPPAAQCVVTNGVAGTGIVVTAGGGGELTQWSSAETVGTAAVGSKFGTGGVAQNSVTTATVPNTTGGVRFPLNSNVILLMKITNSATNRVVSNINMSLTERLVA